MAGIKTDVREAFVISNLWEKKMPCPKCNSCNYNNPPPKNMSGVAMLYGQNQTSGRYVYACSCGWEGEK